MHRLVIGPAPGGCYGQSPAIDPVDEEAGQLDDLVVTEKLELAVAIGEQADSATSSDADIDDIADAQPIDLAVGQKGGGYGVYGTFELGFNFVYCFASRRVLWSL